jgi:hypothetical protein
MPEKLKMSVLLRQGFQTISQEIQRNQPRCNWTP